MHVTRVVEQLRDFLESTGMTESRLARACGLPQSTVHQALRDPKRLTGTHRKLCAVAGLPCPEPVSFDSERVLVSAVLEIWDGSHLHALHLIGLLRAGKDRALAGRRSLPRARLRGTVRDAGRSCHDGTVEPPVFNSMHRN